jgi:hypothetical protein
MGSHQHSLAGPNGIRTRAATLRGRTAPSDASRLFPLVLLSREICPGSSHCVTTPHVGWIGKWIGKRPGDGRQHPPRTAFIMRQRREVIRVPLRGLFDVVRGVDLCAVFGTLATRDRPFSRDARTRRAVDEVRHGLGACGLQTQPLRSSRMYG